MSNGIVTENVFVVHMNGTQKARTKEECVAVAVVAAAVLRLIRLY